MHLAAKSTENTLFLPLFVSIILAEDNLKQHVSSNARFSKTLTWSSKLFVSNFHEEVVVGPWEKCTWLCPCMSPSLNTHSWHAFLVRTLGIAAEYQSPNKPQCGGVLGISPLCRLFTEN